MVSQTTYNLCRKVVSVCRGFAKFLALFVIIFCMCSIATESEDLVILARYRHEPLQNSLEKFMLREDGHYLAEKVVLQTAEDMEAYGLSPPRQCNSSCSRCSG
ncbi:hypothetical protein Trydic_g9666 [Trypoxylus dichotomus]